MVDEAAASRRGRASRHWIPFDHKLEGLVIPERLVRPLAARDEVVEDLFAFAKLAKGVPLMAEFSFPVGG